MTAATATSPGFDNLKRLDLTSLTDPVVACKGGGFVRIGPFA